MITSSLQLTLNSIQQRAQSLAEVQASWLSLWSFWWLNSLIARGVKLPLMDVDMYQVLPSFEAKHLSEQFEVEWAKQWQRANDIKFSSKPQSECGDGALSPLRRSILPRSRRVGAVCKALMDGLQSCSLFYSSGC